MVLPFVWGAGMDTRPKKLSSHQPDLVLENYAYIQGVTVFCFSRPWFSVNKPVGLGFHLFVPGGFTARGQAQTDTDRVVQTSSGAEKEN